MVISKTPTGPSGLPAVDPRIKTLFINNLARAIKDGEDMPTAGFEIPDGLRMWGYTGAAKIMGVADHTVRHYWQSDLIAGRSQSMPPPDGIITRVIQRDGGESEDLEVLPGWTERTIREWMPVRVGTGNHTRGAERRGNPHGRKGWTRATALDRAATKAEEVAAAAAERADRAAKIAADKAALAREAAREAAEARAAEAKVSA